MSGPQCIAWYEAMQRRAGQEKLMDLQVLVGSQEQKQFDEVKEMLFSMAIGRGGEEGI